MRLRTTDQVSVQLDPNVDHEALLRKILERCAEAATSPSDRHASEFYAGEAAGAKALARELLALANG